jgi:uncharacterized protein YndB with AHSA1/START domain
LNPSSTCAHEEADDDEYRSGVDKGCRQWSARMTDPKPWTTEIVELDWRAGGRAAMIMHGPDGETSPIESIVLEVVPNTRFIFTDALSRGWVPQKAFIVGLFELTPEDEGTHYRASARHWDEESMKRHEEMGFTGGWAAVADQLAELAEASHAKTGDPLN